MMWGHGFNTGWVWLFALLIIISLILLILVVVRVFTRGVTKDESRQNPAQNVAPEQSSKAHAILADRFAKGELSAEQYREMLKVLNEE
ncbi:MAG TPA: SHOCT domain-containing protein [Microbacteriaceae bacterium]|nr:SHOCT domain-containing protein [Microbacteriaceae bacterium]